MNPHISVSEMDGAGRLLSLDAFRGLTVAAMILVNNPGTWASIYAPLKHAAWHGWTPTDLIFPFFLFIVGVAITFALGRRASVEGAKRELYLKILKRALIIFALGLVLAGFPFFDLSTIRIPGVLQRIAVCYLAASLVFLWTDWRAQAAITLALLLIYWLLMTLVDVPGYGAGLLDSKEGNLAAYVDRAILGERHIWKQAKVYDPEGILSALPAIATTLTGVLAGHWLRSNRSSTMKTRGMIIIGACGCAVGLAWGLLFPINKPLWTSSYVVFTSGAALIVFAICYWLIDVKGYKRWSTPFVIFGVNALAAFFMTGIVARAMTLKEWWNLPRADGSMGANLQTYIYQNLFASWAAPLNASLLYAFSFVLVWLAILSVLYKRKIFIKV